MGKPSFWERVGRGVGYGWHKARELGSQISDQVEGKLELEKAEEELEERYKALGKLAAGQLVDGAKESFVPDSDEARELVEAIGKGKALVEGLRREREAEKERAQKEEAERKKAQRAAGAEKAEREDAPSGEPGSPGDEEPGAESPPETRPGAEPRGGSPPPGA